MSDFPADFVFGVATSAYQVEGGITNDWTDWEEAGKLKETHARCGKAVDHWNRFDEDLGLIEKLGAGAYRLSLEWARLEPEPGRFDDAAAKAYRERLEKLCARKIRPLVTLHHFTHPRWFHTQSPWHEPASLERWRSYVKFCAEILRGLDVNVCSFNEPMVFLLGGYMSDQMPPGRASPKESWPALVNLSRAHVIAKELLPGLPIGIAQHYMCFAPMRWWHPMDQALTRLADPGFNHALLECLTSGKLAVNMPGLIRESVSIDGARDSMNYVGLNYYTCSHLKFTPKPPWLQFQFKDVFNRGLTDIGWEDYPEGFREALIAMKRYGKPIWVTENGLDDRKGERRTAHMHAHLKALLDARTAGADVRAYFHWSLFDNFEWLEGWGPRFGLYRVNFETLERTPTPAVEYFHRVATSRNLTPP